MKVLFDTSILVAAMVEAHPMHERALPWLTRAKAGEFEWVVANHTLAEVYAVLTTLPLKPRISPGTAWRLIHENVETSAKIRSLSLGDCRSTIRKMADLGLSGAVIYDALIAAVAEKSSVDRLLTLNPDDFKRTWPEGVAVVSVP